MDTHALEQIKIYEVKRQNPFEAWWRKTKLSMKAAWLRVKRWLIVAGKVSNMLQTPGRLMALLSWALSLLIHLTAYLTGTHWTAIVAFFGKAVAAFMHVVVFAFHWYIVSCAALGMFTGYVVLLAIAFYLLFLFFRHMGTESTNVAIAIGEVYEMGRAVLAIVP